MEAKQQHLVIVDAGQSIFISRPRFNSAHLDTASLDVILAKTKLDEVGLNELATLPHNNYKFVFVFSPVKLEYINKIREQNTFLKESQFEDLSTSYSTSILNIIQKHKGIHDVTFVSHRQYKFPISSSNLPIDLSFNRILYSGFAQNHNKRRGSEVASYQMNFVDYHISSLTQIASAIDFILYSKQIEGKKEEQKIINIGYYFDYKKFHQTLSYGLLRATYPFRYTPVEFTLPHENIPFDSNLPIHVLLHKFQDFYKETSEAELQQVAIKQENIVNFVNKFKHRVGIIDDIWNYDSVRTRVATTNEILRILSLQTVIDIVQKYPELKISTPKILIYQSEENDISSTIEAVKQMLEFPVLVKAIEASSTPASHKMAIIHNIESLKHFLFTSPLSQIGVIIQELINHSGIINKLYVAGEYSIIQARVSIPDLDSTPFVNSNQGIWEFDSQKPFRGQLPIEVPEKLQDPKNNLNEQFMTEFSQAFRQNLGLNLFGYDVIKKTNTESYYIVDINCFPGFKNISNLKEVFQNLFIFSIPKTPK